MLGACSLVGDTLPSTVFRLIFATEADFHTRLYSKLPIPGVAV